MKLVLVSKLNFRHTRDSLVNLTANAEYLIKELIHDLLPRKYIVKEEQDEEIMSSSSAISIFDCDANDKYVMEHKEEYQINGIIGVLKMDLPAHDFTTSEITSKMRNLISKETITYIDVRID